MARVRRPDLALVCLWPLAALAWWWTRSVEVFALSEDDFSRMLDAWRVAHGSLFPTDVWPPGPAWLGGLLILVGVPFTLAPMVVNLASITAALALSVDLCRRLGADAGTAVLSAALVGMGHWTGWLGLSGLAEPVAAAALLTLAHGVVRMGEEPAPEGRRFDPRWQVSLAATFAGTCRYEAWAIAALGMTLLLVRRPDRRALSLVQALLPLVFPVAWVALEAYWNGGLLDFATSVRSNLLTSEYRPKGALLYARPFTDLVDAAGPVLPLAALGAWVSRGDRTVRPLIVVWIVSLIAYLGASLLGFAGLHNTPRLWLGHVLLLPVGLTALWRSTSLRAVHVGALALGLATRELPAWGPHPEGYTAEVAWVSQATREAMAVDPDAIVVVEAVPWECVSIKALIGAPERTLWDRDPNAVVAGRTDAPGILSWTGDELRARLRAAKVSLVVTSRPATAERLAKVGRKRASFGPHTLWEVGGT